MRALLRAVDESFAFATSGRFELLAQEHVPFPRLGAVDVDATLRHAIEHGEGVISVVGRVGSGKSSLIASVVDQLDERFVPLRVTVIGVEAGDPAAFIRHAITEIRNLPATQLTRHEERALDRAVASERQVGRSRELRAGLSLALGAVLSSGVVADIKRAASEELKRATDPAESVRGLQYLLDVFWRVGRCPVLIVEDTDHWISDSDVADGFFDQTARAFTNLDAVMVVATQADYTELTGYRRLHDRLTAEVRLPRLPDLEQGLGVVLTSRLQAVDTTVALSEFLESEGLRLLAQSHLESVVGDAAGDLRRTLATVRTAVDVALSDPVAERVTRGHIQEAIARTPLSPSSALGD